MRVSSTLLVLSVVLVGCTHAPVSNPDPNHTHADFSVWIEGQQVNFAREDFMSGVSTDDTSHDEPDEYRHMHLHLHDGIGNVIHRHKPGLTIGDFFASIGFTMTTDCFTLDTAEQHCTDGDKRWRMFINGEEWPLDPAYVFQDLDQILLTYGSPDDEIARQLDLMTDDACLYSRTCPERGDPPAENCIADPAIPCVAPLE